MRGGGKCGGGSRGKVIAAGRGVADEGEGSALHSMLYSSMSEACVSGCSDTQTPNHKFEINNQFQK
jgi:hypothetical protein